MKKSLSVIMAIIMVLSVSSLFFMTAFAAGDGVFKIKVTNEAGAAIYKDSEEGSETYDVIIPAGTVVEVERIFGGETDWWAELSYEGVQGFVLLSGADGSGDAKQYDDAAEFILAVTDKNGIDFYTEDSISADLYGEKIPYGTKIHILSTSTKRENGEEYLFGEVEYNGNTGYVAIHRASDGDEFVTYLGVGDYEEFMAKKEAAKRTVIIIVIIAAVLVAAAAAFIVVSKKKKKAAAE